MTISDGSPGWHGLGPISVLPELQKQGIGKSLIREGLSSLKSLGEKGCVLVGDPGYYERFGFRVSRTWLLTEFRKRTFLYWRSKITKPAVPWYFMKASLQTANQEVDRRSRALRSYWLRLYDSTQGGPKDLVNPAATAGNIIPVRRR